MWGGSADRSRYSLRDELDDLLGISEGLCHDDPDIGKDAALAMARRGIETRHQLMVRIADLKRVLRV